METQSPPASPNLLRDAMVQQLRDEGWIRTDPVARAMGTVARHLFANEVEVATAYEDTVLRTKKDEAGVTVSSVSAPSCQADMLERACLRPGQRVLEIGSGGVNAAYIREIVTSTGLVFTLDIDPEVVERAERCLQLAGYSDVVVVCGDGERGIPQHGPFDRIIVTVEAMDVPNAWWEQLAPDGVLVLPLRVLGRTRVVALRRDGDHLVSDDRGQFMGFVPMRGVAARAQLETRIPLTETVTLRFDQAVPADAGDFTGLLDSRPAKAWSGVTMRGMEPHDVLQLWLANMPGAATIAIGSGDPLNLAPLKSYAPAAAENGSVAFLVFKKVSDDADGGTTWEAGAVGYGPDANALAEHMAEQMRVWDAEQRGGPGPQYTVWPAETVDDLLPAGRVADLPHGRVVISWPGPTSVPAAQPSIPSQPAV
ncbi:protein-L-isoaspartate(D-aspartate) O-methyltransferase [Catenulispora sp. GAS73]|uniref:methyltransferase, FxLD system n=1 Tax=Catenulispora sp. GAS73 TaxID=3156269 RepID=UPI003514E9E1